MFKFILYQFFYPSFRSLRISSTTFRHSGSVRTLWPLLMNSSFILAPRLRMYHTLFVGGMRGGWFILACIAWHLITHLFQVCSYSLVSCFHCCFTNCQCTRTAASVEVKRLFSRGRMVLSQRSRLSVQSTRALLCLGSWSILGLVRDEDVMAITRLDEVQGRTCETIRSNSAYTRG